MTCFEDTREGQIPVLTHDPSIVAVVRLDEFVARSVEAVCSRPLRSEAQLFRAQPRAPLITIAMHQRHLHTTAKEVLQVLRSFSTDRVPA